MLLVALLVGGAVGGVIEAAVSSSPSTATASEPTSGSGRVTAVAEQVIPSVVTIAVNGGGGAGTGSGVVIRSDGHILTNNHVISAAAATR